MNNIIFCGNPGSGKSTLCNCIFGRIQFKSGVSVAHGFTKNYQEYQYAEINYIDTPGLADVEYRREAARQISVALKKNGPYKIVFVVCPLEGRIIDNDMSTIIAICDAIRNPFEYGIIYNKLSPAEKARVIDEMDKYIEVLPKRPFDVLLLDEIENAVERNDYLLDNAMRQEITNFVGNLTQHIIFGNVRNINVDVLDQRLRQVKIAFYTSELTKEKACLQNTKALLNRNIEKGETVEDGLAQKGRQKFSAETIIANNNKKISELEYQIEESNRTFKLGSTTATVSAAGVTAAAASGAAGIAAGTATATGIAVGGAAAAAAATVAAPIALAAAPLLLAGIGIASARNRSKTDAIKKNASVLTSETRQYSKKIDELKEEITAGRKKLDSNERSIETLKETIKQHENRIRELEKQLRAIC